MGQGAGFEWISGFVSNLIVFLVEFIPLANIDGIVLVVNRFRAIGGRVEGQEHRRVEVSGKA